VAIFVRGFGQNTRGAGITGGKREIERKRGITRKITGKRGVFAAVSPACKEQRPGAHARGIKRNERRREKDFRVGKVRKRGRKGKDAAAEEGGHGT